MANLFGGTDLFGRQRDLNMDSFNPQYQNVSTGVTDVGGKVVGQTQLDPYHYASRPTADQVAQILGGTVDQTSSVGPGANPTPQYGINFGDPNHSLNAGLAAKTLEYATKGRLNADTGQYEKEPMEAVMARLAADARPPLYWQQQGQANPYIPNPAGTMAIPGVYSGGGSGGTMRPTNGGSGAAGGSGMSGGGVGSSYTSGAQRPTPPQQTQQTTQQSQQADAARRAALAQYIRNKLYTGNNLGNMSSYRAGQPRVN